MMRVFLVIAALALLAAFWGIAVGALAWVFTNPYAQAAFWGGLFVVWVVYSNRRVVR